MKIIEALKNIKYLRVSCGSRWLVFGSFANIFVVYEQKKYARKAVIVIETTDEDEAVAALTEE